MSAKHTPGPLSARVEETITIRDSSDNQLAIMTFLKTREGGRRDVDEIAATARLFAAAPDLLDALRIACDHIEMDALEISHCKDTERIRAAIAKAEGSV